MKANGNDEMTKRMKAGLLVLAGALTSVVVFGVMATAGTDGGLPRGTDGGLPRGPYIDFCPTRGQIEAHLVEYGFDYKPTVACGEGGEELPARPTVSEDKEVSESVLFAREKERLLTATRGPDVDGDPLTMELVFADGTRGTIFIQGDPEYFKDMTPAEFAEVVYP